MLFRWCLENLGKISLIYKDYFPPVLRRVQVGELIGVNSIVLVGQEFSIKCKNYVKPTFIVSLINPIAGEKIFTLCIANVNANNISKYYSFNIHQTPGYNQNSRAGWAHVEFCSNASFSSLESITCGGISNIRQDIIDGRNVILVDINVAQYGRSDIYITGMHPDTTEITDVTDNVM